MLFKKSLLAIAVFEIICSVFSSNDLAYIVYKYTKSLKINEIIKRCDKTDSMPIYIDRGGSMY